MLAKARPIRTVESTVLILVTTFKGEFEPYEKLSMMILLTDFATL